MSVSLMSLVFEADIPDLPYKKNGKKRIAKASTVNSLLLAYADHANDEGEGSYPGYTRLERKTKLSRQGISDTLEACQQNKFMTFTGKSKLATNSYLLNKPLLKSLNTPLHESSHLTPTESSHLTPPSQATRPARVKPLDLNHPLTSSKPPKTNHPVVVVKATTTLSGGKIKNPFYKKNLETCAALAITQPTADKVANATPATGIQVDPDFIRQHVETLVLGESLGLAIRRILGGETPRPYPPRRENFTLDQLRGIQP